jgi:hypothetical protein
MDRAAEDDAREIRRIAREGALPAPLLPVAVGPVEGVTT